MTTHLKNLRSKLHTASASILLCLLALCNVNLFAETGNDSHTGQPSQPATSYSFTKIDFPEAAATETFAINNQGEVVGSYYTCVTSGCQPTAFTDVKGKLTPISCALENGTTFFDINNKGEIVGSYAFFGGVHGFIWQGNSSCFDIVDPNGPNLTEAWGVNDSGDVVGYYEDSADNYQGFLYVNGTYTTIACPGWIDTRAYGISDTGVIVGDNANSTTGPYSGMEYKSGKCSTVNFPKAVSTSVKSMNKSGQISGWYTDSSGVTHGFIKTGSTFQTINYPGATGTLAFHLNDKGQIAGYYADASGTHGFVATPKQ